MSEVYDMSGDPQGSPTEPVRSASAERAGSSACERGGQSSTAASGSRAVISEDDWDQVVHLIRQADEVALACHVLPDGDALGSMLALGLVLERMGKRVVASFGDHRFTVPRLLRFLPAQRLLSPPADFPAAPELMITLDSSTLERLGLLAANAGAAGEVVVIDHHPTNAGFGTRALIDPTAAGTVVLVEELIHRLGETVTIDVATCLYVGLVTDTGSFRYSSTTAATHEMAARLVATGLPVADISRALWDRAPFAYQAVLAAALGRAVLEREGHGLVWTYVTKADRAAQALPYEEIEGVIDIVRRADEAEVAVVLKEDDDGAWQVSTRSRGAVDVAAICSALGGGGHASAAGFTSHEPVDVTMARFRDLLRKS